MYAATATALSGKLLSTGRAWLTPEVSDDLDANALRAGFGPRLMLQIEGDSNGSLVFLTTILLRA